MKHLHYGALVIAISDELASTLNEAAHDLFASGRSAVWPVAGYRDERDEVAVQLSFGPGIPFAITDTWLGDDRPAARYDASSIAYIRDEHESLEKVQGADPENVIVYGRWDRETNAAPGTWGFSGCPEVRGASSPEDAVRRLNAAGYEIVSVSESGGPGDNGPAWSNLYIVGRVG